MKRFHLVITLSSGEVLEHTTSNPDKYLQKLYNEFPEYMTYNMLRILNLETLVKGYVVSVKIEEEIK